MACKGHRKDEALSVVIPTIHGTSSCGLSITVLGGVGCEVLMAVNMHILVFYIVKPSTCYISTKVHKIASQKTVIPMQQCNKVGLEKLLLLSYTKISPPCMEPRQSFIIVFTGPSPGLVKTSPHPSAQVSRFILILFSHQYLCLPVVSVNSKQPSQSCLSSVRFS
jgi:hypothetical protein